MKPTTNCTPALPPGVGLDDMLKPEQAADWLKISKRELMSKARVGVIPRIEIGAKTIRFHPRTIIQALSRN